MKNKPASLCVHRVSVVQSLGLSDHRDAMNTEKIKPESRGDSRRFKTTAD